MFVFVFVVCAVLRFSGFDIGICMLLAATSKVKRKTHNKNNRAVPWPLAPALSIQTKALFFLKKRGKLRINPSRGIRKKKISAIWRVK